MGLPPLGLPTVVERRRENRVTGVCTRTDRRSLETRVPTPQEAARPLEAKGHSVPRNARTNPYVRGLAKQGNREVCHDIENKSSWRPARSKREHASLALSPATAPSRRREALPR